MFSFADREYFAFLISKYRLVCRFNSTFEPLSRETVFCREKKYENLEDAEQLGHTLFARSDQRLCYSVSREHVSAYFLNVKS